MRQLPEICEFCRCQIQTLERCIVFSTHEEKRAGEVTFKEAVTDGVICMSCSQDRDDLS